MPELDVGILRKLGGERKLFEYEFRNVLDVSYGAYVVNGACSGNSNTTRSPNHNDAVATIQELLRCNTADVRLSAGNASTAISIIQTFADAADRIGATLATMEGLASKTTSPDYSRVQVEQMQKEFKNLSNEINKIVKVTEYKDNKIFTAGGKSISIPIGDGSMVVIFAKDFSFSAEGLDLTTDPGRALSSIKKAIKELSEYRTYLNRQFARTEDATATIESEAESAMGVELDDFTPDIAIETAINTKSRLLQDSSGGLDTQANTKPTTALKLLTDTY